MNMPLSHQILISYFAKCKPTKETAWQNNIYVLQFEAELNRRFKLAYVCKRDFERLIMTRETLSYAYGL